MGSITSLVQNAAQNAATSAQNLGACTKNAAKGAIDINQQQKIEQKINGKIDQLYKSISDGTQTAIKTMETTGVSTLGTPIRALSEINVGRFEITEEMSKNQQTLRNGLNKMSSYHEKVIRTAEQLSVSSGNTVFGLTRLLLMPIRSLTKLLKIEGLGALIQNSIALAAGFTARIVSAVAFQVIGNIAPYAVAGGAIAGLTLLALKVSPVVGLGIVIALILAAQQGQIYLLNQKVGEMTENVRAQKEQLQEQMAQLAQKPASGNMITNNPIKSILGIGALAVGGYYAYQYRTEIGTMANKMGITTENAKAAIDAVSTFIGYGKVFG